MTKPDEKLIFITLFEDFEMTLYDKSNLNHENMKIRDVHAYHREKKEN